MKRVTQGLVLVFVFLVGIGGGIYLNKYTNYKIQISNKRIIVEKPLDKYTIEELGKRGYRSEIILDNAVATTSAYTVFNFHFISDGKKVTGLTHIPNKCVDKCPVIAQFRGYSNVEGYYPGFGTKRSAEYLAKNGYISLAPDFLGYGESDNPSANVWEARFETYTTALNLLAGIEKWEKTEKIGIWGHSNGGHIALTVLEISQKEYPTVLWAPVTIYFPYSVLVYTDDSPDWGKTMRNSLAEFEKDYDSSKYSLVNYVGRIRAPILLQQGTADEWVPARWSKNFVEKLKNLDLGMKVEYIEYPGADHNLSPSWEEVVKKDVDFYRGNW